MINRLRAWAEVNYLHVWGKAVSDYMNGQQNSRIKDWAWFMYGITWYPRCLAEIRKTRSAKP